MLLIKYRKYFFQIYVRLLKLAELSQNRTCIIAIHVNLQMEKGYALIVSKNAMLNILSNMLDLSMDFVIVGPKVKKESVKL